MSEIYLKLKLMVYNMKKRILIILLFLLTIFVSGCYMKVEEDFFINELTKLTFTVGDEIKITVNEQENWVSVIDHGRGVPFGTREDGENVLVSIYSKSHTGGKFNNDN